MDYPALNKLFLDAVDRYANPKAQFSKTANGWESISAGEMLRRVAGLSKALGELGIKAGDRVGIFAPNCAEWHVADFAITGLGAASVPVYFNESADRLTYILNDSGARIVITKGEAQARKIAEARERVPGLEHVISVAPPSDLHGEILRYETLIATGGCRRIPPPREASFQRSTGDDHLHLRNYRRTEGCDAEPFEPQLECDRLAEGICFSPG
jgi:long-subunit acyl-CoA synthetase (AMP-forming)